MRIDVDVDKCVAGGQCVLAAPDLFDQDDYDGTVVLLGQPGPGDQEAAREAAQVCPSRAITVHDA